MSCGACNCNGLGVLYESSPSRIWRHRVRWVTWVAQSKGKMPKADWGSFQACIVRWPWTGWTPKRGTQELVFHGEQILRLHNRRSKVAKNTTVRCL